MHPEFPALATSNLQHLSPDHLAPLHVRGPDSYQHDIAREGTRPGYLGDRQAAWHAFHWQRHMLLPVSPTGRGNGARPTLLEPSIRLEKGAQVRLYRPIKLRDEVREVGLKPAPPLLDLFGREAHHRGLLCRQLWQVDVPSPRFTERLVQRVEVVIPVEHGVAAFLKRILGHGELDLVGGVAGALIRRLCRRDDAAFDKGDVAQHLQGVLLPAREHVALLLLPRFLAGQLLRLPGLDLLLLAAFDDQWRPVGRYRIGRVQSTTGHLASRLLAEYLRLRRQANFL
mmetsp:Transcript_50731/g.131905  ORF Transcript_50731/g.131905 Transcript_50731/m.131905 type:complete len:284 (-) Transcript_50731:308-1159(-)